MTVKKTDRKPFILIILDGWGLAEPNRGNAIALAETPIMDALSAKYPFTELCAHAGCVGLSEGQDGNSEAGHLNIGAGRVVEQDEVMIGKSISDGTFFKNPAFKQAIRNVETNNSILHIMGMLSNGMSAHSNPQHLEALLELVREHNLKKVCLHFFTDGRDSPKFAAVKLIEDLEKKLKSNERIATIMGRYYGMDRKKEWSRTEMAYDALVSGKARIANNPRDAILEAYNRGEDDEFIEPYIIADNGTMTPRISDKDSIIFFNLRSDRARQLAKVFIQKDFCEKNQHCFIPKKILKEIVFVGMTDFGPDLDDMPVAFPSIDLKGTLPMTLSGLSQLYIAETEKYAHVTYFFNGGYQGKVANEDQLMIDSPQVKSYDETPEMSSQLLAEEILKNLRRNKYIFTVLNFAAPDMIGHTGNLAAGIECCRAVDHELGRIVKAYLKEAGTVMITADHGNIEEMIKLDTGEIDTEHSSNPVPLIIVNDQFKNTIKLEREGKLGDVAPTILDLLGRNQPKEMSGKSLIRRKK